MNIGATEAAFEAPDMGDGGMNRQIGGVPRRHHDKAIAQADADRPVDGVGDDALLLVGQLGP
jgi:hypothetical protein